MLARDAALKAGDLSEFAVQDKKLTDAVNRLIQLEGSSTHAGEVARFAHCEIPC